MTGPLSIALSGLNAASLRANAAASNIANAGTSGATEGTDGPEPYTPIDVVQTGDEYGVKADLAPRNPSTTLSYQPDAPYADSEGYVATPDVDYAREIVDLKQASIAYKANAAVVRISDEMSRELLNSFDKTV